MRLFAKIFLPVLSTVLLAALASLLLAIWTLRDLPAFPPPGPPGPPPWNMRDGLDGAMDAWRSRLSDLLSLKAQLLASQIEARGLSAARDSVKEFADRWGIEAHLVVVGDRKIAALSAETASALDRASEERRVVTTGSDWRVAAAVPLGTATEPQLVLVGQTLALPTPPPASFAFGVLIRIAPLVVMLGLVCYFLARYITNPLFALREALRRFARGDLEHRISPCVGNRKDEIGEVARDFDQMAQRIATLLNAQRRLLQDVSHELRSPLARQRIALELLREEGGPSAARALERAELEAQRLDDLIGELLGLARLEGDPEQVERGPVDLAAIVHEVVDNAEFERSGDEPTTCLSACADCVITGVPALVRRAIENVVRNALAFTAAGTSVEVALFNVEDQAVIRVRDHGPGVSEAELSHIFRPFYRVSWARDRQTGGTGLGLAIVSRAVHAHAGSVTAKNHPDGGLMVEIRLPRDPDATAPTHKKTTGSKHKPRSTENEP